MSRFSRIYSTLALGMLLLAGCGKQDSSPAQAKSAPPPVPVVIGQVQTQDVPLTLQAIGNVEATESVDVKSQITAELTQVHFTQGQDVARGQLLFSLDRRQLEADVKRAEGNLLRDEAQAKNARVQAERYAKLLQEGVVARQQYDQFMAAAEAGEATVAANRAALEYARLQLQYTRIYAPISGRTGNLAVHRGNLVKANDLALVTINQIAPIDVSFAIPEQQLLDVKRHMASGTLAVDVTPPASATTAAGERPAPMRGRLTFTDNAVDPATGTIKLKASFPNADRKLWPGQFVDVNLTLTTQKNATVVPSQAVQTGQQGSYIFVVKDDMTAEMRPVTVARTSGNISVITEGARAGEKIVTDGMLRLMQGSKVQPKDAAPPSPPKAGPIS